jgi:hypothetical protein
MQLWWDITLFLQAREPGIPGFPTADTRLEMRVRAGSTLATVLDKLNTYRSPEHQLTRASFKPTGEWIADLTGCCVYQSATVWIA